jgi:type I restriction enzyme S subunit
MLPYLRVANVLDGSIDYSDVYAMHFSEADQKKYTVRKGDILLNEGQSTELVGRSAIFEGPEHRYCYQNSLVNFRCGSSVIPQFARAVFKRWLDIGHFTTIVKQTTSMAHLGGTRFANLEFPVPPVPEQRRIAEILDTLDEAMSKTEQLIAKLKQVKQGLLYDLLTRGVDDNGELRDPDRKPEQFKDSQLGRMPRHWETTTLRRAADLSSGTTPARSQARYWSGGTIPWVKTGEVNFTAITATEEAVTELALSETPLRLYSPGTVLIAMYGQGATRGRSAILSVSATTNQACAAIQPHLVKLTPQFLFSYLKAQYEQLRSLGHGSNQTNLSATLLGEFALVLPPLQEQLAIVAILDTHDIRTQLEEREVQKLTLMKQGLMEDLLTGRVRVTNLLNKTAA